MVIIFTFKIGSLSRPNSNMPIFLHSHIIMCINQQTILSAYSEHPNIILVGHAIGPKWSGCTIIRIFDNRTFSDISFEGLKAV
jgi:hypothetical protein